MTLYTGLFLIVLGIIAYLVTGMTSITALIPTLFGIPITLSGLMARHPGRKTWSLYIAQALAILGFVGSVSGIPKTIRLLGGQEVLRPEAGVAQAIMAIACLILLIAGMRRFLASRSSG
jgi:hypothetical protein